jgi:Response regulators consisting of a CheY-like receiver domain and a winged-helix DNA-binding domain
MNKNIAVVDDEQEIAELISLHLKKNGFGAKEYHDAGSFLKSLKHRLPDLVILDVMLPDMDGFEICKHLKRDQRLSAVPVIMLTARGDETDKVLGLELGADDYVTKPFSPKELVARVKVVLRRNVKHQESKRIEIGPIAIDLEKYAVSVEGKDVLLTTTEFKILELLASKPGWVFSRDRILDHLWGEEKIVLDRTIDVHIKNLREKLGKGGALIRNVRGVGYKLAG